MKIQMKIPDDKTDRGVERRRFLRDSGVAAASLAGLAAVPAGVALAQNVPMPMPNTAPYDPARDIPHPTLSRQFARWVAALRYEDLPPEVIDRARGVTLHALSSLLLGSQMAEGKDAVQLVTEEEAGVRTAATILVHGAKATRSGAAFANSEMTLAGGKWDTFRMLTHPGTSIIPSALVAAEENGAAGKDFITGIVAGYEVMERMAGDFIPTVMARGFHASPVFGIFGAESPRQKFCGSTKTRLPIRLGCA